MPAEIYAIIQNAKIGEKKHPGRSNALDTKLTHHRRFNTQSTHREQLIDNQLTDNYNTTGTNRHS